MATPEADKLRFFFPSKYLSADDDTLTVRTADSGGSLKTIVDAGLTEVDDYWNGAIGYFLGNTTTVTLRSVFFHVQDFDSASDTLTLYNELPTIPVSGDTFVLILGGNYRSNHQTFGMLAATLQPENQSVTGTNITGLTITKISACLEEGTLYVFYDNALAELYIKMDSGNYGVGLDVSGDVSDGIILDEFAKGWIQVDVINASLPGSSQTDTFALTFPIATFTPDYEGAETSIIGGKIRYRLEVIKNTDINNKMKGLSVYTQKPPGTDSTIDTGETLGTGEDDFSAVNASDWPTNSFWVKNTTVNAGAGDCRYVKFRSGNRLYCEAAGAGLRGYTATSWAQTETVIVMDDVDLGLQSPSADQFSNPIDEETLPAAVTFSDTGTVTNSLSIGDFDKGNIYGVWRREWILENHKARANVNSNTIYTWT